MEEKKKNQKPVFENKMTPLQQALGWIYLPLHAIVIPLLFLLYNSVSGESWNALNSNMAYYSVGIAFVMTTMFRYLRTEFDTLLDRLPYCLITMLIAMLAMYALNTVATLILMALDGVLNNPNNAEVMALAGENYGVVKALSIFIAPIVEEVLFRGVLFGSVRRYSRGWAYVLSVLVFSVYHVWQTAVACADWTLLLYALQYIPISIVLAWCYERSGSLWTNIFYHMGYNALSFALLSMLM